MIDPKIKEAFQKVKKDMNFLKEEIKQIKDIVESLSLSKVQAKSKVSLSEIQESKESLSLNPTEIKESKSKPAANIIERTGKNIARNMKGIMKNEILNLINKNKLISISHLQTIICEEKRLCSRASFFNYMKELKEEQLIYNTILNGQKVTQLKEGSEIIETQNQLNF